jgi:adenylate cyclase
MRQRHALARHGLLGLCVGALCVAAQAAAAGGGLERRTLDLRFDVRGVERPARDVALVEIDGASLRALHEITFPFKRSLHARAIDRLRADGAKAIAYDVAFVGLTRRSEDLALGRSLARARNVAVVTDRVDANGATNILGGDAFLRAVGARPAHAGAPPDPGGVIRRMTFSVDHLATLPVVAGRIAGVRGVSASSAGSSTPYIDFAGPAGTLPALSFGRLVRGEFEPGRFRGRVVVVGPGRELERHPTSVGQMPGAEIQASALATVLRRFPLRPSSSAFDAVLIVLLALAPALAVPALRPWVVCILAVALVATLAAGAQLAFEAGRVIPVVVPAGAVIAGAGSALAWDSARAALGRLRGRFAQYVPEAVIAGSPDQRLRATVLFSDVRGFTAFAETREPELVVEILNRYLTDMSDTVSKHGGTVVDYMGDGIMAAFGAPEAVPDHAGRALAAAMEMLGPRLESFNDWLEEREPGTRFEMGVGINTGTVFSSSIGSGRRLAYTAIGDATNVAARLEALTKNAGRPLLLSESTRDDLGPEAAERLVFVGELALSGREAPVRAWSLAPD